MTSHTDERSSSRYEWQAEATRHSLAHNLDELSDRLTPGQVFDEMLTYARGSSGTFLKALTNATRENPVPSLLIGAGCMLFLSEKMGLNHYLARRDPADGQFRGHESTTGAALSRRDGMASRAAGAAASGARTAAHSVRSGVRSAGDLASEQASSVAEGVKKGAEAVGDTISEAGDQIKQGAQTLTNTVQDYSASIGEQVADSADRTRRAASQAKDSVVSFVHEQPLLSAAIGLAIGAAIAAMIPSTDTEDELMGEASDAVKDAVGEVASDQIETAKAAATRVAQEAKTIAEREGFTPSGALDKIKTVVSEAGAAGKSEVRELAGGHDKNNH